MRFQGVDSKKKKECLIISLVIFSLVLVSFVNASDVAYIYKMRGKIDQRIVDVFSSVNLETDFIKEGDISKTDLSKYKLIFVGDENFKTDIPIDKYPSVVASSYISKNGGLLETSGITRLVSNTPLKVDINGKLVQVYISSKDNNGVALPYYYLDKNTKADAFTKYAATYSTSGGEYLGDVISFASSGGILANGKSVSEGICFYGITKTQYWTSESRDLFKDCIKFVYDYTYVPPVIYTCTVNADCGSDGFNGAAKCTLGDVFKNYVTYTCVNGGTESSKCESKTVSKLFSDCTDGCTNGVCNSPLPIVCSNNAACNDNNENTEDVCVNPGTTSSSCTHNTIICINNTVCNDNNENTEDVCVNPGTTSSSCTHTPITCRDNSMCDDSNANTEDVCVNPGTTSSSCSHNTITKPSSGGGGSSSVTTTQGYSKGTCITQWECGEWSVCTNGQQTRTCDYKENWCKPRVEKPVEKQSCTETISPPAEDMPVVEAEEEVEQSTPSPTTSPPESNNNNFPITGAAVATAIKSSWLWVLIVLVIGGVAYWYFKKK